MEKRHCQRSVIIGTISLFRMFGKPNLGKKLIERRLAKNKSAGQLSYDKTLEITDIGIENIEIFSAFGDNVEKFSGWWVETLQL